MKLRLLRYFVLGVPLLIGGCTRVPEEPFSVGAAVTELPELHQDNIQSGLRSMFGTPTLPRVRFLSDAADQDVDPVDEDETAQEKVATASTTSPADELLDTTTLRRGALVYRNRCSGCHGISGDGQGPAADYLQPKPRDYRKAIYKFTSTPYGARPARQDLIRTIRRGAKGTSMPAFAWMSDEDLEAVVDYVIYLSLRGRVEESVAIIADDYDEDETIESVEFNDALQSEWERWQAAETQIVRALSAEPAYDEESVKLGRSLYIQSSCYQCHGMDAKGQTQWLSAEFIAAQQSAPDSARIEINYDAWGHPAPAADITARMLHGGRRPIDIYRRVSTGINGTPMPAFAGVFAETPEAIWHLVHYVMHIVDGGEPMLGTEDTPTPRTEPAAEESG